LLRRGSLPSLAGPGTLTAGHGLWDAGAS